MENLSKILPDIASLDETIYLQSFTTSANAYGELDKTWTTYATEKARIEYAATGSGEDYSNHVNLSTLRIGFTIRWRDGVTVKDRVKYNDEYYDIVKVAVEGRRRFIEITADRKI